MMMERIAIATENGQVSLHFGKCPEYTIAELDDGKLVSTRVISNPGHEPGVLPEFLASQGVDCVIAGGMGPRAQQIFESRGVRTITGVTGDVEEVIRGYVEGALRTTENTCDHGPDHKCNHHE